MAIVERDFIMRLVKQLAELLARAMKLKAAKRDDEAIEVIEVIESGCLSLLGIDWKTLAWVDSASAAQLLKEPARFERSQPCSNNGPDFTPKRASKLKPDRKISTRSRCIGKRVMTRNRWPEPSARER